MHSDPRRDEPFPTTHWSLVARAGEEDVQAKQAALEELLHDYMPALRAHLIVTRHVREADAEDTVQQFVTDKILQRDLIARADARRGKFRTFLLVSLDRFYFNQIRQQRAQKRAPVEARLGTLNPQIDPPATPDSSDPFDLAWARTILESTIERMRMECEASGRDDVWGVFQCRLADPILHHRPTPTYSELVERFQFKSPAQAANILVTWKRMFTRCLRDMIGRYACDRQEIDSEIDDLLRILESARK